MWGETEESGAAKNCNTVQAAPPPSISSDRKLEEPKEQENVRDKISQPSVTSEKLMSVTPGATIPPADVPSFKVLFMLCS